MLHVCMQLTTFLRAQSNSLTFPSFSQSSAGATHASYSLTFKHHWYAHATCLRFTHWLTDTGLRWMALASEIMLRVSGLYEHQLGDKAFEQQILTLTLTILTQMLTTLSPKRFYAWAPITIRFNYNYVSFQKSYISNFSPVTDFAWSMIPIGAIHFNPIQYHKELEIGPPIVPHCTEMNLISSLISHFQAFQIHDYPV